MKKNGNEDGKDKNLTRRKRDKTINVNDSNNNFQYEKSMNE